MKNNSGKITVGMLIGIIVLLIIVIVGLVVYNVKVSGKVAEISEQKTYIQNEEREKNTNTNNSNNTTNIEDSNEVENKTSSSKNNSSTGKEEKSSQKENDNNYLGTWSDGQENEFTVRNIGNNLITFSWFFFRTASIDDVTIPIENNKAVFYYSGVEDKNYNNVIENTEHYYRKAEIELKNNKVIVKVSDVNAEEHSNNLPLEKEFNGGSFITAGEYIYSTRKDSPKSVSMEEYSKYLGTWSDGQESEFTVRNIGNNLITFTWFIFRTASLDDETVPFENGKASFYFSGVDDKNYNDVIEDNEHYYRKATIELADKGVIVTVTDISSEEHSKNLNLEKNFDGSVYITAGEYKYLQK